MKLIVALAFAVTAVSAAHAQKGGGLLPRVRNTARALEVAGKNSLARA